MWNLQKYKNNIAIITEENKKITYNELDLYCTNLTKNIKKRCLVFNLCRNEIGSLAGYVGFLNSKTVPLLLSADLDEELLLNCIETYKPDYINLPSELRDKFNYDCIYENLNYSLLKTPYNNEYPLYEDLALLLTTSGSTGSPKLVRQSYKNIKVNTESIIKFLKINENERAITTLPMTYTYGLSVINTHLYSGASIILTEKGLMQEEFWKQLKENNATSLAGVPYTYEMLERLKFFRMNLPSINYLTQSGGKLPFELHKNFSRWAKDNNKKFIVMYGMTEATARIAYLPNEKSQEKYGSIGISIPGGRLSLIDDDNNEITTPNTRGEIVYKGDNVTLGYAQKGEDLIKGDERFSILKTGDIGTFDEDGYFYIVGRKKRFLKIFGNRVNLDETENIIKSYFKNIQCACCGVDDEMHIYITNSLLKEEVLSYLSQKTGLNKSAFKIFIINEIPKNEAGKIMYKNLEPVSV